MKNKNLIIISALVISSIVFTGCNTRIGMGSREDHQNNLPGIVDNLVNDGNSVDNNTNNDSSNLYNEELHQTMSIDDIKKLDISILGSDVTIKSISGNDITLDCTGSSNIVKSTTFEKSGDTLTIQENGVSAKNISGFNINQSRKVFIGIPETFNSDSIISCGAGAITINDLTFKSLNLKGGAGELNLSNIVFDDLILHQGVGETNIDLNKKCGNMNISGGIGELYMKLTEVGGNLTYKGGIGEATFDIPDNSPVKLITDTGLGDKNISVNTSGEDTYIFDLKVGMGTLTVK